MTLAVYAQTGRIIGTISTEKGIKIHGAVISLEPDKHIVQSNSNGTFVIKNLYPGTYYMRIEHTGYTSHTDTVVISAGQTATKSIILADRATVIDEVRIQQSVTEQTSPDQLLKLSRSAMPVQVISRQAIEQMGSRRLDEVLKEQTGIAIVNNVSGGSRSVGVQIQGFGSEYVMVLIDGQPMIGRNNGNFDLSRISVANIERIEIIKGASSCLFGSDALGGAINIITRYGAIEPQSQLSLLYGSLNLLDVTLDAETPFAQQRGSVHLSTNYYRTDGFNTNPYLQSGQSSPPYSNFDTQARIRYQMAKKTYIGTSFRYGSRTSDMSKNWDSQWQGQDKQNEYDINYTLSLEHTFRSDVRSISRYYLSHYNVDQFTKWQGQNSNKSELQFAQTVHRYEQQFAKNYRSGFNLTAGLGGSIEHMQDETIGNIPNLTTLFAYLQGDKRIAERLDLRGGLRYDHTGSYGGRLNPSAGLQYYLNEKLSFKAGIGSGFKAPDFRMRYLVFFNPAANYLVIGNEVLKETLTQMQQKGDISEIFRIADRLDQNLKPEQSISFNLGTQWKANSKLTLEAGIFLHHLRNQIDPIPVATGTKISQLYSYQNLPKVVNKGLEANMQWQPLDKLQLQLGYQYLIAKDRSVTDSIQAGNWPYNQNLHDPKTGQSFSPRTKDYWGMINRSRHMLNAQLFYTYTPWNSSASLRINYRGKYPFADYNGNDFIDRFDHFVPEHLLINAYFEKRILKERMKLRFTLDNILDVKHELMPGQAGRIFLAGFSYRISR
ncbi:MAG: TonB-dependent receptor [Sphingobacterium sp.]|jgi:outer membrane receptor for ferrienterochelin and colicins|nr:TonB-dependent receptor [Sphingobacterium sp.]